MENMKIKFKGNLQFFKPVIGLIFMIVIFPGWVSAIDLVIDKWLRAGVFQVMPPAFDNQNNIKGKTFEAEDLLKFKYLDLQNLDPVIGQKLEWYMDQYADWMPVATKDSGTIIIKSDLPSGYSISYYATYLYSTRWAEITFEVNSKDMFELYLDGTLLDGKYKFDTDEPGKLSKKTNLIYGNHLVLLKVLHENKDSAQIIHALVKPSGYCHTDDLKITLDPTAYMNIHHLLDGTKIGSVQISPSGNLVAIQYRNTKSPSGETESWTQIKEIASGKMVQSFRNASIQSLKWLPVGNKISYLHRDKGKTSLFILDLDKGEEKELLSGIEHFSSYQWSPKGSYIIYSVSEAPDKSESSMKRHIGMHDRYPGWRSRGFLYKLDVNTLVKQRLTFGHLSTQLYDISPDEKTILFGQSAPDYSERPYSKQNLFKLNVRTFRMDTIWKNKRWGGNPSFSPDGKKLLITGGPSAFGKIGENVKESEIPNNYDGQVYIYDLENGNVDPITHDFDPAIRQAFWNLSDGLIYLIAEEKDFIKLYRYNPGSRKFYAIPTGIDVVNSFSFASSKPVAVYTGSGISTPRTAFYIDLKKKSFKVIEDVDLENYNDVRFGKTENWNFKNKEGETIIGRVYYPPDFDPSKKYPLIVNYYGGTSPVGRSFGGRYPLNLYAANGYVVYVLQPSGATGFGQEFSAKHVNNWGITVADEIIDGTRKFLADLSFIDPAKVGCIGASYGGFMTMLLQTRTDIFTAAISHAGISSISSYWGEGYWGYLYSAEATAESFPWNNMEIYINQSPLFHADKIKTPLLLLHGSVDTNVPPGESIQLYTALKLLGRPVELITITGENHHILTYSKRIEWNNTILAWFDKWLKEQNEWWNNLYPEGNF